jgi:AraC-like DNA-binding protein
MSVSARELANLPAQRWSELGAYGSPFSGTGMEFLPLGAKPEEVELLIHEAGYLPRRPHWDYQNVFSPFWRLYYDLRPGHEVVFAHGRFPLGPDRIILIPDHQLFHTAGTQARPKFWVAFSCPMHLAPDQPIPLQIRPAATERHLIHQMIRLLSHPKPESQRRRVYHCSLALLHVLLGRPETRWQMEAPRNLLAVVRYVEERYASPIYVAGLAQLACMSEGAFRRSFKTLRGISPARFIAQTRVREAAHLLATTGWDMSVIADRAGFPNPSYFSRVFKRVTGQSPAEFRTRATKGLPR